MPQLPLRNEELLLCVVPDVATLSDAQGSEEDGGVRMWPILLVRDDGVIYPCNINVRLTRHPHHHHHHHHLGH